MSEVHIVAVTDTNSKKVVIFDLLKATVSVGQEGATIVTDQGVKVRANPQEIMALYVAGDIGIAQMVRQEEAPKEEAQAEEPVNV